MKNISVFEIVFKIFVVTVLGIVVFKQLDNDKKIVYVDSIKLLNQYRGMKEAKLELEVKVANWKKNADSLRSEFESDVHQYELKENKMSLSDKKLTEKLLTSKQQQLLNYQQVIEDKIQKEQQDLAKRMTEKVDKFIKDYGKKNGYKVVLSATQYGNVIYADETVDITDEVIAGLNQTR